jgi:hypothetical protein
LPAILEEFVKISGDTNLADKVRNIKEIVSKVDKNKALLAIDIRKLIG